MDKLTGLMSKKETENEINQLLYDNSDGVLIIADIQGFQKINTEHGYLLGDRMLQELSRILRYMLGTRAVIGRIGSDIFAAFLPGVKTIDQADQKARQLCARVEQIQIDKVKFSLHCGTAARQAHDNYLALFRRATIKMPQTRAKMEAHCEPENQEHYKENKAICMDMKLIQAELDEEEFEKGAYCQSYDSFKILYRFEKRVLERSELSVYTILVTLTDEKGDVVSFEKRELLMEELWNLVKNSLRRGDSFTRYSSSQYVLMVLGPDYENAKNIGRRLQEAFKAVDSDTVLQCNVYPIISKRKHVSENH